MRTIRVERTVQAPIEQVFEGISDHAGYVRFRGIRSAELVRPGHSEPNGLGALRRIKLGPLVFEEEITAFDRPVRMDYLITKLNVPFHHEGGSIRLEATPEGTTKALWTSAFEIPIPVVGGITAAAFAAALHNGFVSVLKATEKLGPPPR